MNKSRCPYYKVLGINETASIDEIKQAYFKMLKEYPSDKYPERHKEIVKAYMILSDPERKKLCDKLGNVGEFTLEEFLEKNKGKRISDLGIYRIKVAGQQISIYQLTCQFCKERIVDPQKLITLDAYLDNGQYYVGPGAFLRVCPQCFENFYELNKIMGRVKLLWNFFLIIGTLWLSMAINMENSKILAVVVLSPIAFILGILVISPISIFKSLEERFGKFYNWTKFEDVEFYIQIIKEQILVILAQYGVFVKYSYDELLSKISFKLQEFPNLGKANLDSSSKEWKVSHFGSFKLAFSAFLALILLETPAMLLSEINSPVATLLLVVGLVSFFLFLYKTPNLIYVLFTGTGNSKKLKNLNIK